MGVASMSGLKQHLPHPNLQCKVVAVWNDEIAASNLPNTSSTALTFSFNSMDSQSYDGRVGFGGKCIQTIEKRNQALGNQALVNAGDVRGNCRETFLDSGLRKQTDLQRCGVTPEAFQTFKIGAKFPGRCFNIRCENNAPNNIFYRELALILAAF